MWGPGRLGKNLDILAFSNSDTEIGKKICFFIFYWRYDEHDVNYFFVPTFVVVAAAVLKYFKLSSESMKYLQKYTTNLRKTQNQQNINDSFRRRLYSIVHTYLSMNLTVHITDFESFLSLRNVRE